MASTCPAWTEACCGNSGKFVEHRQVRSSSAPNLGAARAIAPEADRQEREERQHGQDSAQADQAEHGRAVFTRRRVVVVTEQQEVVDRRADALLGRFDQAEPEVARRELDAVEVFRDVSFRRQHLDGGAVRELLDRVVVLVAEPDRLGERVDRRLSGRSGSASPAPSAAGRSARGSWPSSARPARALARVEAHHDDVELAAGLEVHHRERADQPVEHLRAEHRALVVRERDHDRPLAEVVAEPHLLAGLVDERQIQRQLPIEVLIDVNLAEEPGFALADRRARARSRRPGRTPAPRTRVP